MLAEVEGLLHFPLVYWISFRNRNKRMLPFFQEKNNQCQKISWYPHSWPQFSATPTSSIFPGTFLFEVNNRQSRFYANCDQLITFWCFMQIRGENSSSLSIIYPKLMHNCWWKIQGLLNFLFFLLVNSFLQITKLFTTSRVNEQAFWDLKTALTMAIVAR